MLQYWLTIQYWDLITEITLLLTARQKKKKIYNFVTKIELVTSRIISTMSISTCHFFLSIFTQNIDFSAIPFSFFDTEVLSLEPELVNIKWNLAALFDEIWIQICKLLWNKLSTTVGKLHYNSTEFP